MNERKKAKKNLSRYNCIDLLFAVFELNIKEERGKSEK